ncbi:MAG: aldehyde dehydrogenase family protein [Planctomycetota bacterium]|nr:aldehyde dehydrogenase family protein [Planctomycetota bacterium]
MTLHSDQFDQLISRRTRWAGAFADRIMAATTELSRLAGEEIGKPREEVVTAEVLPLVASCRWHRRHARSVLKPRRLGATPWWLWGQSHQMIHRPLGRVAIIATWNYPIQLLGIQIVQAAVAGNTVVVKPSEHAPRTQTRLLELAWAAGLEREELSATEATRSAGEALLAEHDFDHVVFTGSTAVGRRIAQSCAQTLTSSTLELSGRDSALVLEDANPSHAARCIWNAVATNAGQTCMAPRRALVHEAAYRAFCETLVPLAASAQPRRLVLPGEAAKIRTQVREAIDAGGRSAAGILETEAPDAPIRPTAVLDCPPDAQLVQGDHFGPALAVVPVPSTERALEIHASIPQHLATSVWTARPARIADLADRIGSATVMANDVLVPTAHPAASIEGRGESGWGPSRGRRGLHAMSRTVHASRTPIRLRIPPEPPTESQLPMLERITGITRRAPSQDAGAGTLNTPDPQMEKRS